jgi:predicted transcriptional regulator
LAPGSIGQQELECLLYLAQNGPLAASAVWEGFGAPRGLARTTVLTVLERLRRKGHLGRRRHEGVYVYRALEAHGATMRRSVGQFVERALGGSISPFAAYLTDRTDLSEEELAELRRAVDALSDRTRRTK